MNKFERIKKQLEEEWGFELTRCHPENGGWIAGDWKTGYQVIGYLRGYFYEHYSTLKQVEERWLKK